MAVLLVAKDLGAATVLLPLASQLLSAGVRIIAVAEGPAFDRFANANIDVRTWREDWGSDEALALLRGEKPRAVVTGLSSPINAEEVIGLAANWESIPLAVVEDFWGAHRRTKATPQIIATLDEFGARHARVRRPEATIVLTGNPGAREVVPSRAIEEQVRDLRRRWDRIYIFSESGPSAAREQLSLLVSSLKQTSGRWCLVPCFHPKWEHKASPEGFTYGELWRKILQPIVDRIEEVPGSRDELAAAADATVSAFSTLLTIAAFNKRRAICLWGPASQQYLQEISGLLEPPHAALGIAAKVRMPQNLEKCTVRGGLLKPYDPTPLLERLA